MFNTPWQIPNMFHDIRNKKLIFFFIGTWPKQKGYGFSKNREKLCVELNRSTT